MSEVLGIKGASEQFIQFQLHLIQSEQEGQGEGLQKVHKIDCPKDQALKEC